MEVPKQSIKDSQLQLEGLFSEDSPEGEGRETASEPVRKNPEEGNQPTITGEEESLLTKTLDHIVSLQKGILNKNNGWSYDFRKMRLAYLVRGWVNYFRLANAKQRLIRLDEWIRHKIRAIILKANRRVRSGYRLFRQRGVKHEETLILADARQGTWALSGYWKVSRWLSTVVLRAQGYFFFGDMYGKLHRVV